MIDYRFGSNQTNLFPEGFQLFCFQLGHLSMMTSVAHQIPFDILVLFAQAGGHQTAISLASTCRAVKRLIDERFEVRQLITVHHFFDLYHNYRRRRGVVGKPVALEVNEYVELKGIPPTVRRLMLWLHLPKSFAFPPSLKELDMLGSLKIPVPYGLETLRCNNIQTNIPESLKKIDCHNIFVPIPCGVESLTVRTGGTVTNLPPTLRHLKLGHNFNEPIHLTTSLETLCFGFCFNQSIDQLVANQLTELRFGACFNQPINRLPPNLKLLEFGLAFNRPVSQLELPVHLETLWFGLNFNQPIDNFGTLKHLKTLGFGKKFTQSLEPLASLPCLKTLQIGPQLIERIIYCPHLAEVRVVGEKLSKNLRQKLPGFIFECTVQSSLVFKRSE